MSALHGLDTAAARETATAVDAFAQRVEELRARLSARVGATTWTGPDADAFRAGWAGNAASLERLAVRLTATARDLRGQSDEQDAASAAPSAAVAPALVPAAGEPGVTWPWEDGFTWGGLGGDLQQGAAHLVGDAIGWGLDAGAEATTGLLDRLGLPTSGLDQAALDAQHAVQLVEDWTAGETVPTVSQLVASGLVVGGSSVAALGELATGQDNLFFDDRPGVQIGEVQQVAPSTPQSLGDLLVANAATVYPDPDGGDAEQGRIRVQEVVGADGESRFIVQTPPTKGAGPGALASYGEQGNSRDWASNLRLVAGQDVAATAEVRAALDAAGVPPGAELLMVGHSQGGIVNAHLAADPGFNSASGEPGTYRVTDTFSIGSPIEHVVSAGDTRSVNVVHGLGLDPVAVGGVDLPLSPTGDLVPALDLDGLRVDGSTLADPRHVEVVLDGADLVGETDGSGFAERVSDYFHSNHGNLADLQDPGGTNGEGWYHASVVESLAQDAGGELGRFQESLVGRYLGEGAEVVGERLIAFGRDAGVPAAP